MTSDIGRWQPGGAYGPVLTQTDLYLLKVPLELHPLLSHKHRLTLGFDFTTGNSYLADGDGGQQVFSCKEEPATVPRVTEIIIVTERSPWCTIVHAGDPAVGITLDDVFSALYRDYTETMVTDEEFGKLPNRAQENMKRMASLNAAQGTRTMFYQPAVAPTQFRRSEWLREYTWFECLETDKKYLMERLGYNAPNQFKLVLNN